MEVHSRRMNEIATEPVLLYSRVLTSPHGFSTRKGGVSSGMFESLNFGNPGDLPREQRDSAANIRVNFERVLEKIGASGREIVEVHQVHGKDVHVVRCGKKTHAGETDTKADALVSDDPGRVLVIRVADCAPVLLESKEGRIVGAAHAGWRGAVMGVVSATVKAMEEMGARNIRAAIGPCIGTEAFEVGTEVVEEFEAKFGRGSGVVRLTPDGKGRVDLKKAIEVELGRAGVEVIETMPQCTVSEASLFFSHRRDKGLSGRMIGVIGPKG